MVAAGFHRQTLYAWRRQAEAGNVAAIAFVDTLEKAQAEAEADAVSDVRKAGKAGPQFWAASMTRLERRHPERWGRRQDEGSAPKVVVQIGAGSGDVNVQIASLSPVPRNELSDISTGQVEIPRPIIGDSVNYAALPEHTAPSSQGTQDVATQASDASARTKARRTAGGARRATPRGTRRGGRG